MEVENFLGVAHWKILESIAKKPASPMELAKNQNTSVSYISQQLKLLEAAGLINRKKNFTSEPGKPRILFSLSKEIVQVKALINENPYKKILSLTQHQKILINIWSLETNIPHKEIERAYWLCEPYLDKIEKIYFENSEKKTFILIITKEKEIKKKIESSKEKLHQKIFIEVLENLDLSKKEGLSLIYDKSSEGEK